MRRAVTAVGPGATGVDRAAPPAFREQVSQAPADYAAVDLGGLVGNLLPVTIGNILGGTLLVGAVYWLVYLRGSCGPGS